METTVERLFQTIGSLYVTADAQKAEIAALKQAVERLQAQYRALASELAAAKQPTEQEAG